MSVRKLTALVQARLGSTRFPGKVLAELHDGHSMLQCLIDRLSKAERVSEVIVITPWADRAEIAGGLSGGKQVLAFDVPESNLVQRHLSTCYALGIDEFIRVPSDNPCVDPDFIDRLAMLYLGSPDSERRANLFTNFKHHGYEVPDGVGGEIYHLELLERIAQLCDGSAEYMEHPHLYAHRRGGAVRTHSPPLLWVGPPFDVNTPEDLERLKPMFADLGLDFRSQQACDWMREHGQCG